MLVLGPESRYSPESCFYHLKTEVLLYLSQDSDKPREWHIVTHAQLFLLEEKANGACEAGTCLHSTWFPVGENRLLCDTLEYHSPWYLRRGVLGKNHRDPNIRKAPQEVLGQVISQCIFLRAFTFSSARAQR